MLENLLLYLTPENIAIALRSAILLFVGLPIVFLIARLLRRYLTKKYSAQQGMIVGKVVVYSGFIIILIAFLNELGFKLTHLVAAAGIAGVAIGFAAQTSLSNVISGFFLIAEQPFVVGDTIAVAGITGDVLAIDMLSVKIRTFENKFVRIPNETILKSDVTNITYFPIRRLDLPIGIAYKEDVNQVREVLLQLAHDNPLCLHEPPAEVRFTGFGSSSIDLTFVVWVERTDFLTVKTKLQEEIKNQFDALGIEIPFPHVSLYKGSLTEPIPVQLVDSAINNIETKS